MLGKTRWELDGEDWEQPHWQDYIALLESQKPFQDFEYTRTRPSGAFFRIRTSGIPIFDDDNKFIGYRGVNREVSRDVLEREVAEEQARALQKQFFDAMEQLDAGFSLWDPQNCFVYCNSYFREMQGEVAEYLVPGLEFGNFMEYVAASQIIDMSDAERGGWLAERLKDLQADVNVHDDLLSDGRWIRIQKQRLDDGSTMALHSDITHQKNVEKLKDEFLSLASHELRTPLTSIKGALGLLQQGVAGDLPESSQEMLSIAYRNSERLSRLVDDFLDMSKIESGELELEMTPLPISDLLAESIDLNANYAEQFGCTYNIIEPGEGLEVSGDSSRLAQVMANLLSNAAKFSPENSDIEIAATVHAGRVKVSVRDFGDGVAVHFRDKIFNKFTQADSANSKTKYGTGLGLSIAKEIVEMHGGEIGFTSHPDQGTTFWFTLPQAS